VFGLPGGPSPSPIDGGLPIPIPSTTDQTPQMPGIMSPGLETATQPHGPFGLTGAHGNMLSPINPIDTVIARLGIHPHSGLAQAFRAIHAALTQHLAEQAAHNRAQVGHGLAEPGLIFHTPQAHSAAPVHQRPGPVLQ